MKVRIIYHSKTGNTEKVAQAISEAVDANAERIPEKGLDGPVDLLFIGDGIYAGRFDSRMERFINSLSVDMVRNAAVFGTYGGQDKAIKRACELLEKKGIHVVGQSFGCRGRAWVVLNRRHPDDEDLKAARRFARHVVESLSTSLSGS